MSDYTTELRFLVSSGFDLGLTEYPIFDEEYRTHLNTAIIMHFYFREIGTETAQMFKYFLNRKMSEIMPKYNGWYEVAKMRYDPLSTISVSEVIERERKNENTSKNNMKNNSENKVLSSDTPMGTLGDPFSEKYASNASVSTLTDDNTSENKTDQNENEKSKRELTGKNDSRTYGELIRDYRETLINVDTAIFDELEPLFIQIWR